MKVKVCPKCGSTRLGERWCKGRMLEQYCGDFEDIGCSWKSEPYTPPKKHITNTTELPINDFHGWHYIVYDKYGYVAISSATYDTRAEAMVELTEDMTPKAGYNDPAAPYTAVLFIVPANVTIKGTMFKMKSGSCVQVKP